MVKKQSHTGSRRVELIQHGTRGINDEYEGLVWTDHYSVLSQGNCVWGIVPCLVQEAAELGQVLGCNLSLVPTVCTDDCVLH